MPNSFAQSHQATCPHCHRTFTHTVWLIVDIAERPDLRAKIQAGTLHTATCPHCHTELGQADAPLLVYRPSEQPALLFSTAQRTSQQEDEEHFQELLNILYEQLGMIWTEAWIEDNVEILPYTELQAQLEDALPEEDDIVRRALALDAWLSSQVQVEVNISENDIAGIVDQMRRGLSNEDDIAEIIDPLHQVFDQALGNPKSRREEMEDRVILIEQFINQTTWQMSYQFVCEHPELLDDLTIEVCQILLTMLQQEENRQGFQNLAEHLSLLQASRELGLDEAFRSRLRYGELEIPPALQSLINEITWLNHPSEIPHKISLLEQILSQVSEVNNPSLWVSMQGELGNSLLENQQGSRADNVEQAISHITQALEIHDQDNMPNEWHLSTMNLANAYFYRIRGKRADNLEQAIQLYEQVLQQSTSTVAPIDWAKTINNLAGAYFYRIRGDRAENIEHAIRLYEQALQVQTRTALPAEWATTTSNLGTTYTNRILGKRSQNIKKAIELYEQALQVQTPTTMPVEWATTATNLAFAYYSSKGKEWAQNVEKAIELYKQILQIRTRAGMPHDWARTNSNLALAYLARIHGIRADNIEEAIQCLNQALKELPPDSMPLDWATATVNLALAYSNRINEERVNNIKQAIYLYRQALEVVTLEAIPTTHQEVQQYLGGLYFREENWTKSLTAYGGAIAANKLLLGSASTREGQLAEVGEVSTLFARTAYALLQLGQFGESLVQLDGGKARLLAQAVGQEEADVALLTAEEQEHFSQVRANFRELQLERQLLPNSPGRRPDSELSLLQEQALNQLNDTIAQLRAAHPDFMPEGLGLDELLQLIPAGGAMIAPVVTSHGGGVLVVPHGVTEPTAAHYLSLPDLTEEQVGAWVIGSDKKRGWLQIYLDYINNQSRTLHDLADWETIIAAVDQHLLTPVREKLTALGVTAGAELLLMPQGRLGLLPLHQLWLDEYTVRYAPSGYAIQASQRRLASTGLANGATGSASIEGRLLAVINPTADLPFTPYEGQAVAGLFGGEQTLYHEGAATLAPILEALAQHDYLHFSCHGNFGWGDSDQTGLSLAHGERLTLRDILTHRLRPARLVTLSACETGMTDVSKAADEFLGLPAAFLQAGAIGVVGTLWAVNDLSTTLLMERFYSLHLGGMAPAQALRQAQIWLRDVTAGEVAVWAKEQYNQKPTPEIFKLWRFGEAQPEARPFAHPYFWAGFTFSGV